MGSSNNSTSGPKKSPLAKAMHEKANPLEIIASGSFIVAFLALMIFAQQFADTWFVRTFLNGWGIAIAVAFLFFLTLAVVSQIERRMIKRKKAPGLQRE